MRHTLAALLLTLGLAPAGAQDQDADWEALFGEEAAADEDRGGEPRSSEAEAADETPDADDPEVITLPAASPAPVRQPSRRERMLEEIVVTAQKREESITDVPISVSSISADQITEANLETLNDLSKITPNVKISADAIYNIIYIRGLGTQINSGFEQSVGVFIDDIYYSSPQRLVAAFFDIERIEVLRGPQGTLFGRNTIAGALSLHTGTVEDEFGASLEAVGGELDWSKLSGSLNLPLGERFAVRLAAQRFSRDGFVFDRLLEEPNGNNRFQAGRLKARYDLSDTTEIILTLQTQEADAQGQGDQYHEVPPEFLNLLRVFDPEVETRLEDLEHSSNFLSGGLLTSEDAVLRINSRLWQQDISLIAGYAEIEGVGRLDADFGPAPLIEVPGINGGRDVNLELRVLSDPGTLEYVGGLYYYRGRKLDAQMRRILPGLGLGTLGATAAGQALDELLAQLGLASGNLLEPTFPVQGNDYEESRNFRFDQDTQSLALYGQLTWNLNQAWSLLAGARLARDDKSVDFVSEHFGPFGVPGVAPVQEALGASEFDFQESRDEQSFTPKLSAIYRFNDELNAYATWAQGFKAGGFNAEAINDDRSIQFEPETSNTFELGLKGSYFGGAARFSLGLFRTEFEDLQVSVFNGLGFDVDNAAEAISQGVELELTSFLPGGFLINASASYLDGEYSSFPEGPCPTRPYTEGQSSTETCNLTGAPLAGASPYQTSISLGWFRPLSRWPLNVFAGVDYYWQDDIQFDTDQDPLDSEDAYSLWNLRAGFGASDESWDFSLFLRNVTNEIVKTSSFDVPVIAGAHVGGVELPRTLTARLSVTF